MAYDIPSISDLEAIQLLNKHYAEVVTSKKDGIASGSHITQTTNPITGVTRRTLYKILDDMDDTFLERLLKMAFTPVGTFTSGATLTDARQTLLWEVSQGGDGHYYSWSGSFPKVVAAGSSPSPIEAGSWVDRTDDSLRDEIRETVFQNMKHQAAEAGFNLVDGSFEEGANISGWPDVVWCQTDGKYYQWYLDEAKTVAAGSTPATSGGIGVGAWVSVSDASLRSDMTKPTGAGLSGFDKSVDYAEGTVGGELKNVIFVNPDMYTTLQEAIDYAASLTGLEHSPSSASGHPDWIQPNTVCKVVRLNGKKYPINTTLHIHGDVSIDAGFGGVYLTDDFIADSSGYAVNCDKGTGNQYAGHISNFLIDARAKTVNGFKISDGYANKLDGIYVANVDGHGIHIAGGMGVHLLKFYAVGALKPTNPLSTAHIVEGSDHQVSMGEGRYFRFGTWVRGGGNNRIDKVHNWGMYDDTATDCNSRMKCCFVVQNSINNSFNQCFADSPSKWDYTKANLDALDGYINGGIGFFIDAGATGNTFSQCQTFVNMTAFNDAGLSSYTASLMPFAVGSINCSFIECENSNSPAWVARLINHIYYADQSFTNILAAKNFVGIEYDMVCNSTIFRKNVGVPVLVRTSKFETPTASYAPNFSDASYISATVTGNVTITPTLLTNTLTGYVEVLLSIYSLVSKTITFGANVKLAINTPSLTASGTQVFRLSTTDEGATWFCKFESAYL